MALLGRRVRVDGRDGVVDNVLPNMVRVHWLDGSMPAGSCMAPKDVEPYLQAENPLPDGLNQPMVVKALRIWYGIVVVMVCGWLFYLFISH
ncbi:MAG: hypothetical protein ACYCRD_04780 [Leptospirillum sp.]